MAIKILVPNRLPLLKGEHDALAAHFGNELSIVCPEIEPTTDQEYLQLCRDTQPDAIILCPGFNKTLIVLAVNDGFEHFVIITHEVRTLDAYRETAQKIEDLLQNRKYQTT